MAYLGQSPGQGQAQFFYFRVLVNGTTTFGGVDTNGYTLNYTPGGQFTSAYLNGRFLAPVEYTATDGSTIVLPSGAKIDDIFCVVALTTFNPAAWTSTATAYVYSANSSGQSIFQGADVNGRTLAITNTAIQVSINGGVIPPSDYTANTTAVVLASNASPSDVVMVWALNTYNITASLYTQAQSDARYWSKISSGDSITMRNKIINGAMMVDQRLAGSSVSPVIDNNYNCVDRFVQFAAGGGVYSAQQVTTSVPTGFKNSLKLTVTTADASIATTDYYGLGQRIEGLNCADLDWGLSTAKTVTLSFWVNSSVTGTYSGSIRNSASDRSYPFTYAIPVANTWTAIQIVIPGDTTGTWLTTTGIGACVVWDLGTGTNYQGTANAWTAANKFAVTGSTQWIATNGATFYVTGVQLEVGSVATPFENRLYGFEFSLCQRYFETFGPDTMYATYGNASYVTWQFKIRKRATPTVTGYGTGVLAGVGPDFAQNYQSPAAYAYWSAGSTASAEL
jgi:hypothetical protein